MSANKPDPKSGKLSTQTISFCGICTVFIIVCSFIQIPFVIPITLQTFAIFFLLLLLGGKHGIISILLYLLLGACGIPVFHGMTGGFGILLGNTGGYLFGFLFIGLCFWIMTTIGPKKLWFQAVSLFIGLLLCYFCGTIWFLLFYVDDFAVTDIYSVISGCVLPFVIPDILKLGMAVWLYKLLQHKFPHLLQKW